MIPSTHVARSGKAPSSDTVHDEFLAAYDEYADAIFRHCYFRVFDRERGRELMQDAFMRTWVYLSTGKKIDNLRAFLYRTANNLIVDEIRRQKRRTVESLEDKQENESFDIVGDDGLKMGLAVDEEIVLKALEQVEEPYRTAVIMRYIDEMNPKEIADALGESANAVSVRVNRGVQKLRTALKKDA